MSDFWAGKNFRYALTWAYVELKVEKFEYVSFGKDKELIGQSGVNKSIFLTIKQRGPMKDLGQKMNSRIYKSPQLLTKIYGIKFTALKNKNKGLCTL